MIWEAIQRAKTNKTELHIIWLDLANAYGSVPHSLIWKALEMHHVPENIVSIIKCYFRDFKMRFTTPSFTTDWMNLEIGIAMGCTVSPVLFVLAMQVLLKAVEPSTEDAHLGKGVHMPPLQAFMDDTTILTNRKAKAQSILDGFEQLMSWSCSWKVSSAKKPEQAVKSWKSKWTQPNDLLSGASDW